MPIFASETLQRFFNQGETDFSVEKKFLIDRISIPIIAGQAIYEIPQYVVSIRRVTFLGRKLDPLPQRNFRETFQSATQMGRPFWYVYNNLSAFKIQLFPRPDINLPPVTNIWDTDIINGCIIEFYRSADNVTFTLPPYIRRQMLKQYVAKQCFAIEGPGQSFKISQYFSQKWDIAKAEFGSLIDDYHVKSRKLVISEILTAYNFPANPILPIDRFGTTVDEGY